MAFLGLFHTPKIQDKPLHPHPHFRCFNICSSPSLLSCSLDELRKLLLQNGYSSGVLIYNINDVLVNRQQNRPKQPITIVPKKEVFLILPLIFRVTRENPHQTGKGLQQLILRLV